MGDMKCNGDTINPSYIEKIIKEDQNMIQPTEKKRTEGSNQDGQTIRDTS